MKYLVPFILLLCLKGFSQEKHTPVVAPYNNINIRDAYLDSSVSHTTLKAILHEESEGLYATDTTGPRRGWIYRKLFREHLIEMRKPEFNVFVDFLPDVTVGRSSRDKTLWLNTRGVRIQANVGKNFYFESSFYENQGVFPAYIDSFASKYRVIPGQGEVKYNTVFGKTYDFAYVNANLTYRPNKYLDLSIGYGNNFIGDGYRSLMLSDISFSYPYLKVTGNLGNVQYTSMWAQFMDLTNKRFEDAYFDKGYNKKWGVFHFLDWAVTKKLNIGLFDAVIWADADSVGRKRGFDWTYMNPVIFLRPAEFSVGSSDNAMIGLNVKYKLLPNVTTYGQFVLDEFKLSEFFGGEGWWANKWAMQLGFRSFDLFKVKKLDLQGEYNVVRPYTYSFRNSFANYAHYNQSLAHPLGANFQEVLGIASYTYKRWYLRGQITYAGYGLDPDAATNYGKEIILKDYSTRVQEYGNKIGQGIKTNLLYATGSLAYVINPKYNLRLETSITGRQEKNDLGKTNELIFQFGLRTTFRQFYYDF